MSWAALVTALRHAVAIAVLPFTVAVLIPLWLARRGGLTPAPAASFTGRVRIGSRSTGAALYINGVVEAALSSPRYVTIPAGVPVRVQVRCASGAPYDTLVTLAANEDRTIGYRNCQ